MPLLRNADVAGLTPDQRKAHALLGNLPLTNEQRTRERRAARAWLNEIAEGHRFTTTKPVQ